jgi:radical SAM protein with 4Fe4S-binding SPASM domain
MNFSSKLSILHRYGTPRKIKNILLTKFSKYLKLTKVLGYPTTLMLEPTNFCNLNCPLCPTGAGLIKRKKEALSIKKAKIILDKVGKEIFHLRLWNWGEPFLNRDLFEIVKYAKKCGIYTNTSTNAYFLNRDVAEEIVSSGLDQLIISLDGASEKTYNKYRKRGSFKKVLDAIKEIKEQKIKQKSNLPEIKLQFIVMKHNEHEINKMIKLSKEIGVDVLFFKSVGIMDNDVKEKINKYLPQNKEFVRNSFNKIENKCDFLWEEITINVDGSVVPCCRDSNNKYVLGNIFNQPLNKIWNNENFISLRKAILKDKNLISICKNCSGTKKELKIREIRF